MGIRGVIALTEDDDVRLSILDGQHCAGMMSLLEEEQRKIKEKGSDSKIMNGVMIQYSFRLVPPKVFRRLPSMVNSPLGLREMSVRNRYAPQMPPK